MSNNSSNERWTIDHVTITGTPLVIPTITLQNNIQITAGNVTQGTTDHMLSRFIVTVADADAILNQISFTAGGTFLAGDITNFKLYTSATNTFPGGTPIKTVSATSISNGGTVTFSSLSQTCAIGYSYFWIVADIAGQAIVGKEVNVPSLEASNFTFAFGTPTGSIDAGGTQTIIACTSPTDITELTLTSYNAQIQVAWTNPSCYDEVMIVAKPTSSISASPSGDGTNYTANLTFGSGTLFDGTGYVVYKGSISPQTITGLTNGTTYYVKVFTRKGTDWSSGIESSATSGLTGYFWNGGDPSANPANGGTGTWSATNAWRQPTASGSQATWVNNNNAILAGSAGTVTLSGDVTVTELFVNANNYVITPDGTTTRTITGPITIAAGNELRINDSLATNSRTLSVSGNITGGTGSSLRIQGNQTSNNASRLNLISSNATLSVPITITDGGSGVGVAGVVGTASGTQLTSSATITNSSSLKTMIGATSGNSLTVNSVISGTASVQFSAGSSGGAGIITLNAANTYTGETIFNAANSGVILLGIDNALPPTTNVIMGYSSGNGGILDLNGHNQTIASLTSNNGVGSITNKGSADATLTINGSTSPSSFTLPITEGSKKVSLIRAGTGTTELTGACTYTGLTTISGGTLRLNRTGGNTIPATNNVTVNGGTLRISTNQTLNNLTINSGGNLIVDNGVTLTINGALTVNENITIAGNITISSGASAEIASDKFLTVSGTLTNNGTLTIKSDANGTGSLIHNTPGVSATVERYVAGNWSTAKDGWHLISSPVVSQAISAFVTTGDYNGYDFYGWDEESKLWMNYKDAGFSTWNGSSNFVLGRGYLISYEQNQTGKSFSGELNVSPVTLSGLSYTPSQGNGWHLLGNPFASAIKWNDGNWSLTNVANTAKIWHSTNKSYTDINYNSSNNIIPQAQGFFIQVNSSTNSITIPALARVHSSTAWYKNSDVPQLTLIARPADGSSAQETHIRLEPQATHNNDPYWDSRFMAGYAPQLYSLAEGVKLSTNALPSLSEDMEIPLGFQKNQHNNFTLELSDNTLAAIVILKDLKTGITHNLSQQPVYSFTSSEGDDPLRFKLAFASVGIESAGTESVPYAWYAGGNIHFRNVEQGTWVEVYASNGQLMKREQYRGEAMHWQVTPGVYFVKILKAKQQNVQKIVIY